MKRSSRAKAPTVDHLGQGREAFLAGRFNLAAEAFTKAKAAEPGNPVPVFNLASAKERIGEIDEAAILLTQALRLRPSWFEPAQRLALLCARYRLTRQGDFDPFGLTAAFAFERIDLQPLADAAIAHLEARSPLGDALAPGRAAETARSWLLRGPEKTLSHPLFQNALIHGANRHPGLERLLVALRRGLLLDLPAADFGDKAITAFTAALIRQCLNNEHVWPVDADEAAALESLAVDWDALAQGAPAEARKLMLALLYAPPETVIGGRLSAEDCRAIRPRVLRDLLTGWLAEAEERARLAAGIETLGAISDPTSRKVAAQYEAHPYPRWTSLQMPGEGSARGALQRFFAPEALGFMGGDFRVLIAGAGTGKQALAASMRYGPGADVLAIDLSRTSLAYAKAKAGHFGAANLRFAQADLLAIPKGTGPFDIIEAVGVLHHMEEPFKGWQALLSHLRPGGLMLTGLYSATSRQNIADLRRRADYPGPACNDDEARAYRARLMAQEDGAGGLAVSQDFYALSNFRDLVLHEHERPIFLSEIEAFLEQNGLIFRGFNLPAPIVSAFLKANPEEDIPGSLKAWARFEEKHPRLFDAMYQLWCEKAS